MISCTNHIDVAINSSSAPHAIKSIIKNTLPGALTDVLSPILTPRFITQTMNANNLAVNKFTFTPAASQKAEAPGRLRFSRCYCRRDSALFPGESSWFTFTPWAGLLSR